MDLSAEIVLKADDVVFAEVRSSLDLDEDEHLFSRVSHTMSNAGRNVHSLSLGQHRFDTVECHQRPPQNRHPMFGAMRMLLIAQSLAGKHFNTLDLIVGSFIED